MKVSVGGGGSKRELLSNSLFRYLTWMNTTGKMRRKERRENKGKLTVRNKNRKNKDEKRMREH
jgi:ribosomal protein L2